VIVNIRRWRKDKKMTQAEMCQWFDISPPTFAKLEAGKVSDPIHMMEALEKYAPEKEQADLIDLVCRLADTLSLDLSQVSPSQRQYVIMTCQGVIEDVTGSQ